VAAYGGTLRRRRSAATTRRKSSGRSTTRIGTGCNGITIRNSTATGTTMNIAIGSAPDSWGVWFPSDPKQTPWQRYLDEVVQAGYEWTELGPYGYLPADLPTLRAELDRRGLKVSATFAMAHLEDPSAWSALERQATGGGELLAALGGRFLVLIDDTYSDLF